MIARRIVRRGLRPVDRGRDLALAVAAHPPRLQLREPVERGHRERAGYGVAADEHQIELRRVAEHGLQGVDVGVDVVQRQDVHGRDRSATLGLRVRACVVSGRGTGGDMRLSLQTYPLTRP